MVMMEQFILEIMRRSGSDDEIELSIPKELESKTVHLSKQKCFPPSIQ